MNDSRISVIDGGSRYGLHPTLESIRDAATIFLVEADQEEADRLARKYNEDENLFSIHGALGDSSSPQVFNLTQHKGLITKYPPDANLLRSREYFEDEWTVNGKLEAPGLCIDDMSFPSDLRILKLDIEGSELLALKGAQGYLRTSLVGVRAEVFFSPLLEGVPLFGEVDQFLREMDFELVNLDYRGKGAAKSLYGNPEAYGQLVSSDGVWIKRPTILARESDGEALQALALFLMANFAEDYAIRLLLDSVRSKVITCLELDNPVEATLSKLLLLHFKALSYQPNLSKEHLSDAFEEIFGKKFPVMHQFWESELFATAPREKWTLQKG